MSRFAITFAVLAATLTAGCAARVGYSATVVGDGYGPDLVYAAPGVQVIADYDEPIFFADSFYWRYDGDRWSRSTSYTGGWAYATPTASVAVIAEPRGYVHYRPQGWVAHRAPDRSAPVVRDHRDEAPRNDMGRPGRGPEPVREVPRREVEPERREQPRAAPPAQEDHPRGHDEHPNGKEHDRHARHEN